MTEEELKKKNALRDLRAAKNFEKNFDAVWQWARQKGWVREADKKFVYTNAVSYVNGKRVYQSIAESL